LAWLGWRTWINFVPANEPLRLPTSQNTTQSAPTSTASAGQQGQYRAYEERLLTQIPGTKVLFFHAPWCPQCRALEASILAGKVPDDVTILKVDYDSNQALRQKYGVTIQTTVARVDDQGNLVKKAVLYNEPSLESLKGAVLQ
jgi:thiol-disulfide isomerase/thioredoxin